MQTIGQKIASASYHRSYLNDPETKLVATRCAVCRKDLKDSISVQMAIGPDCRKNYYKEPEGLTEAMRQEANAIVRFIAVKARGDEAILACKSLEDLGFGSLAARIARRLVQIRVEFHEMTLEELHDKYNICTQRQAAPVHFHVIAPYTNQFVKAIKEILGAKFIYLGNKKAWAVPVLAKPQLWAAMQVYAGSVGQNPDGKLFVIGGSEAAKPVSETVPGLSGFQPQQSATPSEIEKFLEQA